MLPTFVLFLFKDPVDEFNFFNGSRGILTLLRQRVQINRSRDDFYQAWLTLDPEMSSVNSTEIVPGYLQQIEVR